MSKLEQAARQVDKTAMRVEQDCEEALGEDGMVMVVPLDAYNDMMEAITALREALDHSADTGKMVVPNGYALVSIDALKAWCKYDEVRNACQYQSEQAEQEPVAVVVSEHTHSEYASIKYLADRRLPCKTKLYAAPVRTKDLTDDGISDAIHGKGSPLRLHDYAIRDFRAVIAADRDLNK